MRGPALVTLLAAAALVAAPALAQGKGDKNPGKPAAPSISSSEFMTETFAVCANLAIDGEGAGDKAVAAGWEPDSDNGDSAPFYRIISYTKSFEGLGEVTIWGTIEQYPGKTMGYCRVEASDEDGSILDFDDLANLPDMTGSTQTDGDGTYGAWSVRARGTTQMFAIAELYDGEFQLEINTLIDAAPTEPADAAAPAKTED
ncbi:hypothetical protein [Paradevosia shaoguanensis]|uniref:Uncharacterized protein n=1 Tax=Paradevosia shaoguanensis TaxID=1335043 RepID=A0AA41UCG4_9HYPH|nr:hypothetical protein [Paradevosia shaoguanensis]MCF1743807.1 hypothetical protein [Paradevosia shaoguanensis]MCI0128290.1 hypothetical protein [Paradevosia shaoguanensis]